MKTLTQSIAAIALLGTLTLGMSMDINTQLDAISNASGSDRVDLVNDLKVELQSMTPEERQEVIGAVRAELGAQDGTGDGTGDMTQTKTQLRQRAQSATADGMQQMQGAQMASQKRADAGITMGTGNNTAIPADGSTGSMFGKR